MDLWFDSGLCLTSSHISGLLLPLSTAAPPHYLGHFWSVNVGAARWRPPKQRRLTLISDLKRDRTRVFHYWADPRLDPALWPASYRQFFIYHKDLENPFCRWIVFGHIIQTFYAFEKIHIWPTFLLLGCKVDPKWRDLFCSVWEAGWRQWWPSNQQQTKQRTTKVDKSCCKLNITWPQCSGVHVYALITSALRFTAF